MCVYIYIYFILIKSTFWVKMKVQYTYRLRDYQQQTGGVRNVTGHLFSANIQKGAIQGTLLWSNPGNHY